MRAAVLLVGVMKGAESYRVNDGAEGVTRGDGGIDRGMKEGVTERVPEGVMNGVIEEAMGRCSIRTSIYSGLR